VAEHDPGVANWVERLGHDRGYLQFRWQRLDGPLTAEDGPKLRKVRIDEVADALPFYEDNRISPDQWSQRIAARQQGVAARMIG